MAQDEAGEVSWVTWRGICCYGKLFGLSKVQKGTLKGLERASGLISPCCVEIGLKQGVVANGEAGRTDRGPWSGLEKR